MALAEKLTHENAEASISQGVIVSICIFKFSARNGVLDFENCFFSTYNVLFNRN